MIPTDADRETVQKWLAQLRRLYLTPPELSANLLAELVAAGRAEERERCAKNLKDMADSLEDCIRNDETGRKASERYREMLDHLTGTEEAIRKGA